MVRAIDIFQDILGKLEKGARCKGFPERAGCHYPPIKEGLCLIHLSKYCNAQREVGGHGDGAT